MNDLKLLLEEQSARNNLLEKKQRKFDSESQLLHDEIRQEKQQKDRLSREKEVITAEKFTLESNLAVSIISFFLSNICPTNFNYIGRQIGTGIERRKTKRLAEGPRRTDIWRKN